MVAQIFRTTIVTNFTVPILERSYKVLSTKVKIDNNITFTSRCIFSLTLYVLYHTTDTYEVIYLHISTYAQEASFFKQKTKKPTYLHISTYAQEAFFFKKKTRIVIVF